MPIPPHKFNQLSAHNVIAKRGEVSGGVVSGGEVQATPQTHNSAVKVQRNILFDLAYTQASEVARTKHADNPIAYSEAMQAKRAEIMQSIPTKDKGALGLRLNEIETQGLNEINKAIDIATKNQQQALSSNMIKSLTAGSVEAAKSGDIGETNALTQAIKSATHSASTQGFIAGPASQAIQAEADYTNAVALDTAEAIGLYIAGYSYIDIVGEMENLFMALGYYDGPGDVPEDNPDDTSHYAEYGGDDQSYYTPDKIDEMTSRLNILEQVKDNFDNYVAKEVNEDEISASQAEANETAFNRTNIQRQLDGQQRLIVNETDNAEVGGWGHGVYWDMGEDPEYINGDEFGGYGSMSADEFNEFKIYNEVAKSIYNIRNNKYDTSLMAQISQNPYGEVDVINSAIVSQINQGYLSRDAIVDNLNSLTLSQANLYWRLASAPDLLYDTTLKSHSQRLSQMFADNDQLGLVPLNRFYESALALYDDPSWYQQTHSEKRERLHMAYRDAEKYGESIISNSQQFLDAIDEIGGDGIISPDEINALYEMQSGLGLQ